MKIRTKQELQSLDDELNLFDEDSWDFFSVVDKKEENYEYFDDIRDSDFVKKKGRGFLRNVLPILTMVVVMGTCGLTAIKITGVFDDADDYKAVANIKNTTDEVSSVSYVDGEQASSEELIEISKVLTKYIGVLQSESDYDLLYDNCQGTSVFADSYFSRTSRIQYLFDTNDCYARALREFGSFYNLNRINKIIIKDGIYYCYASIDAPSVADVTEYVYQYSYNMTKNFNQSELTEGAIVKYLLDTTKENPVPTTPMEYCIKFVKLGDNSFKLSDDSLLVSKCIESYTFAITKISEILGYNLQALSQQ